MKYKDGYIEYLCALEDDIGEQKVLKLIFGFAESEHFRKVAALKASSKQELEGDEEIRFDESQFQGEGSVLKDPVAHEGDDAERPSNKRLKRKKNDDRELPAEKKFLYPCRFFRKGACKKGVDCTFRHD